ncbi:hypothetical protein DXG01_012317 [Tephrocybe rancida]|nr:hypothetical protein DXG01_012317 [Tephrocybe rancida]
MGIPNLWPLLAPVTVETSIQRLAVNDGFSGNHSGARALRMGIDASTFIHDARNNHNGMGGNPELVRLFTRCARLLTLPLLPLFVFGGSYQDSKRINRSPRWLVAAFKELLTCLAISWLDVVFASSLHQLLFSPKPQAPGDAEAELAFMSKSNQLDVVMAQDSNIVLFGARVVLCMCTRDGKERLMMYRAVDIERHMQLQLQAPDLLVVALLAGGDHSSAICPIRLAVELAHTGLGRALVKGLRHAHGNAPTQRFLHRWRQTLIEELRRNASGCLSRRNPVMAQSIPINFPSIALISLYWDPLRTKLSEANPGAPLAPARSLDLPRLARFVDTYLVAGDPDGMYRLFCTHVFPGVAMQQLMNAALSTDAGLGHRACPIIGTVVGLRREPDAPRLHVPELRLDLNVDLSILNSVFDGRRGGLLVDPNDLPSCRAWLPAAVVQHVLPEVVAAFSRRHHAPGSVPRPFQDVGTIGGSPGFALSRSSTFTSDPDLADLTGVSDLPPYIFNFDWGGEGDEAEYDEDSILWDFEGPFLASHPETSRSSRSLTRSMMTWRANRMSLSCEPQKEDGGPGDGNGHVLFQDYVDDGLLRHDDNKRRISTSALLPLQPPPRFQHAPVRSILKGYIKRDMGLLAELVPHTPDGVEDGIDAGLLARSFDQPLNKYSAFALEYCFAQECGINGIGAAMAYWNSMDYGHYCEPYHYGEACDSVSGRALAITALLKAIKIKSDTRRPRNGVKAIIDIQAMAQAIVWSERQYPVAMLPNDDERGNELTALRMRDIDRDCMEGLANGERPRLRVRLPRKGSHNSANYVAGLGRGYVLSALSDDCQIDSPKHLGNWLRYRELITGQPLEPDAYLFPHLPSSGALHSNWRMTQGQLQMVIERFAFQAGCTHHSFRTGGVRYCSPGRWSIGTIRDLGRWAALNTVELKEDRLDVSVPLRAKL